MSSKVPIRNKAVAQLQEFVNRNANGEDVLASVAFSSQAVVTVIPTHVRQLQPGALARPASNLVSSGTLLAPALQQLHKSYSHSSVKCHAHSLVVVTDAEIYDPPQAVLNGFKDLGLKKVYFALPNQDDGARPGIAPALPAVITRGFRGPNGLSLTYGQALADLTGQKLVQVPKGATPTQHSPS